MSACILIQKMSRNTLKRNLVDDLVIYSSKNIYEKISTRWCEINI